MFIIFDTLRTVVRNNNFVDKKDKTMSDAYRHTFEIQRGTHN